MLPVFITLCIAATGVDLVDDGSATSVLVMDLKAATDEDRTAATLLSTVLADALEDGRGLKVVTRADLVRLVELESERSALGCDTESTSCLAELAGAMGADYVVSGDVGSLGKTRVVTLNVFESKGARSAGREVVRGNTLDELPDLIVAAVDVLFPRVVAEVAPRAGVGWFAPSLATTGGLAVVVGGGAAIVAVAMIEDPVGTGKDELRGLGWVGAGVGIAGAAVAGAGVWLMVSE